MKTKILKYKKMPFVELRCFYIIYKNPCYFTDKRLITLLNLDLFKTNSGPIID